MSGGGADDGQEKSFDPTPGRLEKARREGDIALSREATAAASYAGFYLVIIAGVGVAASGLVRVFQSLHLAPEQFAPLAHAHTAVGGASMFLSVAGASFALFAAPALLVIGAIFAQQGFVFVPSKIAFKWSRVSLFDNAKQKFGAQGLSEFAISAAKLIGVIALFFVTLATRFAELPALSLLPAEATPPAIHEAATLLLGVILIFAAAVAAIDVLRVRAAHKKRLMMSLEEIKREAKETEGDPHMKQSRRERSRAIATNRMLLDVPKANVVIVNPEHYAVALKWSGPNSGAPMLVAKGVDEMAAKIRTLAAANGVPIRRDVSTARAIYGAIEVGEEIRREHYAAVAAAIHYADTIRAAKGLR